VGEPISVGQATRLAGGTLTKSFRSRAGLVASHVSYVYTHNENQKGGDLLWEWILKTGCGVTLSRLDLVILRSLIMVAQWLLQIF